MADVLGLADGVYRWEGPKRKQTLFKAKLGRLVLVTDRLYFLSLGKNAIGRHVLGEIVPVTSSLIREAQTDDLDLTALDQPGSLEVPLNRLETFRLHGMFKVMTITYRDESGREEASTFAPKDGGMPNGPAWIEAIAAAKAALEGSPPA
jgi:hypothetical protein